MSFKLPEHISKKIAEADRTQKSLQRIFRSLSNEDLVASAKFWMAHSKAPKAFEPDEPIYDSTLWYIIIPELLSRVRLTEEEDNVA